MELLSVQVLFLKLTVTLSLYGPKSTLCHLAIKALLVMQYYLCPLICTLLLLFNPMTDTHTITCLRLQKAMELM